MAVETLRISGIVCNSLLEIKSTEQTNSQKRDNKS
jgi:hypothetical protein